MLIKVMADYHCWPLWVRDEHSAVYATRDPATLGLHPSLVGRLTAWQQWHESMINIADPHDSRPVNPAENEAFAAEGRLLASRIATELPDATVWFYHDAPPHTRNCDSPRNVEAGS